MTAPDTTPRINTLGTIAAGAGFGIAFVSAVAAVLAGLGTRWGWWDFRTGFMILRFAVWAGLAAPLRHEPERKPAMLWTIFVILLVLWLLGMVTSYTMGGLIHILLLLAIAAVLIRVIQGRRPL